MAVRVAGPLGGEPQPNEGRGGGLAYEVLTSRDSVRGIVDGPDAVAAHMVLWSSKGLVHKYDGSQFLSPEEKKSRPCECPSLLEDKRLAARDGRGPMPRIDITFRIAAAPTLGEFHFMTNSWQVAAQLSDLADALERVDGPAVYDLTMELVVVTTDPLAAIAVSHRRLVSFPVSLAPVQGCSNEASPIAPPQSIRVKPQLTRHHGHVPNDIQPGKETLPQPRKITLNTHGPRNSHRSRELRGPLELKIGTTLLALAVGLHRQDPSFVDLRSFVPLAAASPPLSTTSGLLARPGAVLNERGAWWTSASAASTSPRPPAAKPRRRSRARLRPRPTSSSSTAAAATSSCTSSASASATSVSKADYVPASTPSTSGDRKSGMPNRTRHTLNSRETSRATAVRAVELVAVFTATQPVARLAPVAVDAAVRVAGPVPVDRPDSAAAGQAPPVDCRYSCPHIVAPPNIVHSMG
ncbi:recombination directionality factor [Streptomyces sp. NPDC004749]